MNLEDGILRRNIPGRWSTHDEEDNAQERRRTKASEDVDDEEGQQDVEEGPEDIIECAKQLSVNEVPESIRHAILGDRLRKPKTGVKGVLADYRESVALEEAQRQADANFRASVLSRIAVGAKREQPLVAEETFQEKSDEDEDDEFMREYRTKRLQELRKSQARPAFGKCIDVNGSKFLREIETDDSSTIVVVHLYEPAVSYCVRLNRILDQLAMSMPTIKFLRLKASENNIPIDRMTLPILTFYRGGETVDTVAGIADETQLGEHFNKDDVEW